VPAEYSCGFCGVTLDDAALDSGLCPNCGARISPFGDVIEPPAGRRAPAPAEDAPWPAMDDVPPDAAEPLVEGFATWDDEPALATQRRLEAVRGARLTGRLATQTPSDGSARPQTPLVLVTAAIGAILVAACTIVGATTLMRGLNNAQAAHGGTSSSVLAHITPPPTSSISGLGFPTISPDPTALPYLQETPTIEPTSTPYGGIPTPTPMPGAGGPKLDVSPTNPPKILCGPTSTIKFAVSSIGEGTLIWVVTAPGNPTITFRPNGGSLDARTSPQQVVAQGIPQSGATLDFTNTADNSTISVTVSCKP
jgi:hypothetical protein